MKWIRLGIIWFFVWLVIATLYAPDDYSSITFLISDLATDYHPYDFLMTIGFIGYGVIYFIGVYDMYTKNITNTFLLSLIILSALSMILIGIFDTNYLSNDIPVYHRTLSLHSVFAGGQEALFITIILYHIIQSLGTMKKIHIMFLVLSVIFSMIFLIVDSIGLFQRLIFINNGLWTLFFFNKFQYKEKSA